eukprot:scaffold43920_cov69-Phaeocystis_antarctica.AAC.2
MKPSSASSTGERRSSIAWVALAASRMPESKRLRKYPELEASAARCALNSTPSAQRAMSVSFSLRQRAASEEWCASPPLSVILGSAAAAAEDEGLEAARARLRGAMFAARGRRPPARALGPAGARTPDGASTMRGVNNGTHGKWEGLDSVNHGILTHTRRTRLSL